MLIYLGAKATIQNENNEKLPAEIKGIRKGSSITEDVDDSDVVTVDLIITGDSNNAERSEKVTITINTNTGVISETNQSQDTFSNFRVIPDIKEGTILRLSPKDNDEESEEDTFIVKVISINNDGEFIQVRNDNANETFNIFFESLNQLTITAETTSSKTPRKSAATEVAQDKDDEEEVEEPAMLRSQYYSPKAQLIQNMDDGIPEQLPDYEKSKERIRIENECDSIFALSEAFSSNVRPSTFKNLNKFIKASSKIPSWVIPIVAGTNTSNKILYNKKRNTNENVSDYKVSNQMSYELNNSKTIQLPKYGPGYVKDMEQFTRPFENSTSSKRKQFPYLTEGVFGNNKVYGKHNKDTLKDNIIQVFTETDEVSFKKNSFLYYGDCRDYARSFLPTTNILDKLENAKLGKSGLGSSCVTQIETANTKAKEEINYLPTLDENLKYIVKKLSCDDSQIYKLLSAYYIVSQLNFDNFYWHDLTLENWRKSKTQQKIKQYQTKLVDNIQSSLSIAKNIEESLSNNKNNYESTLPFRSLYDIGTCESESKSIIEGYGFSKTSNDLSKSEILNIMMNTDFANTYYKYMNFCSSGLADPSLTGGADIEDNFKNFFEEQEKLLCGNHAINNMIGAPVVISDFGRTGIEYIDQDYDDATIRRLNLSYICSQCELNNDLSRLCINDSGNYDVIIILKALDKLGYSLSVFPKLREVKNNTEVPNYNLENCSFFMSTDTNPRETLREAVEQIVSDVNYSGSIIYSKKSNGHYTAIRLSKDSKELRFIDSIVSHDSVLTVSRNFADVYRELYKILNIHFLLKTLKELAEKDKEKEGDQSIVVAESVKYVIINTTNTVHSQEILGQSAVQGNPEALGNSVSDQEFLEQSLNNNQSGTLALSDDSSGYKYETDESDESVSNNRSPGDSMLDYDNIVEDGDAAENEEVSGMTKGDPNTNTNTKENENENENSMSNSKSNSKSNSNSKSIKSSLNNVDDMQDTETKQGCVVNIKDKEAEREKYVNSIRDSKMLYQYDNYICERFRVKDAFALNMSIMKLKRMKEMETIRLGEVPNEQLCECGKPPS